MKVVDHVNKAINTYPSLYIYDTYEDSAFAVLHHCFIVLGNGIEWAYTGDSKTGGYLVQPRYRKRRGEWERIKDEPYGKEKCKLDPRAFKEKIYYFEEIDVELSRGRSMLFGKNSKTVFESELEELKKQYKVCKGHFEGRLDYIEGHHTHFYFDAGTEGRKTINPYPNFQKKYSCFWEIDSKLIQEDWRTAGIGHLKFWQEYFNGPERVKGFHSYNSDKNVASFREYVFRYYKDYPEKHLNWIQDVRNDYEVQEFDGENFEELSAIRWEKTLKETKEFLSETIERLENI